MKKIISHLFIAIFLLSALTFFILLNVKSSILTPDKLKSIAAESNFYSFAASYVKDNIVKSSKVPLNQGSNFELLNKQITSESIKPTIDSVIDQFFVILDGKNKEVLIPVSISAIPAENANFSFQKNINLQDNFAFGILQKLNVLLVLLGLISVVALAIAVMLGGEINHKLRRLGLTVIVLSVFLIAIWAVINFVFPNYLPILIEKANFFQDGKLVNGLQKLVTVVFSRQTIYYAVEIIVLLILGLVSLFVAKFETKEGKTVNIQ